MRPLALLAALAAGCGSAPSTTPAGGAADVLYLVHNQLWRIGLDGRGATLLATVGDDAHRTGFPRRLPDGRAVLLADDTGAIYPYVGPAPSPGAHGAFTTLGATNVTLHDALCGAAVAGAPVLVYTVTPFGGGHTLLMRADPGAGSSAATAVAVEPGGVVSEPAAWEDGAVLAVRATARAVTIEILDVVGGRTREVVATIDPPYQAHAPARLRDGRVLFVRSDPRDSTDTAVGELFVVDRGGVARTTGITGVRALTVVDDQLVYEVGGANGVSDLVRSNLIDPPVNLTATSDVSEHLGWSD